MKRHSHRPYKRSDRFADEIKQILAEVFIKDVVIRDCDMLTVTKVKVSSDLRYAKVFVSFIGKKKPVDKLLSNIEERQKFIRFQLGKKLIAKFVPELKYYFDDSLENAEKIETLINQVQGDAE